MFSIRNVLLACNLSIAGIVITALSVIMIGEWRNLNALNTVSQSVRVVTDLSKATIELSLERSLTQVAINLDNPIAPNIKALVDAQRTKSAKLFDDVEVALQQADGLKGQEKYLTRLQELRGDIRGFRAQADQLFAVPLAQRSGSLVKSLPIDIKTAVSSFDDLGNTIRHYMTDVPTEIAETDAVIQNAWIVREFGGRERTFFAIATARQDPISRLDLGYMLENHGKAVLAGEALMNAKNSGVLADNISNAIGALDNRYFSQYDELREQILKQSQDGVYAINFENLFQQSEEALQTAISLLNIAADHNSTLVEQELSSAQTLLAWELVATVVVLIMVCFSVWYTINRVSTPLMGITKTMTQLADGDLNVTVSNTGRKDEMGAMAKAVQVFQTNMSEAEKLRAAQADENAIKANRQAAIEEEVRSFEQSATEAIRNVTVAVEQMNSLAGSLSRTSAETTTKTSVVSEASDKATQNIQMVASSAEELACSIQEISRRVKQSAEMSSDAVKTANETTARVQSLNAAADRIGDVVSLISDIAEQTNLLALNATIEAARAGDAGRGFAVVATEVKNLAEQTAKATSDIGSQISEMQGATAEAVTAIDEISKMIKSMDSISEAVANSVEEQGAATDEIASNVQEVAAGAQDVHLNVSGVNKAAEETDEASTQVLDASVALGRQAEGLRTDIDRFLSAIRAA